MIDYLLGSQSGDFDLKMGRNVFLPPGVKENKRSQRGLISWAPHDSRGDDAPRKWKKSGAHEETLREAKYKRSYPWNILAHELFHAQDNSRHGDTFETTITDGLQESEARAVRQGNVVLQEWLNDHPEEAKRTWVEQNQPRDKYSEHTVKDHTKAPNPP